MKKYNPINDEARLQFFRAIDDLPMFRKIVKAVALAGVVYNDPELDSLVNSTDDGDGEELLSEYNEGFNKGCDLIGKTYDQVLDGFDEVEQNRIADDILAEEKGESHG